ncbi:anaerobic ribonucleoside-triphosphate reductase, partial [Streptococcus suis]
ATKRMYADMLCYDKIVELTGSFMVPMVCRSFLLGWKYDNGQYVTSGRMNFGVVTVNLQRISMEYAVAKDKFWEIFAVRMAIAKDALV